MAFPYKDGVKVYSTDQGVYDTRKKYPSCWAGIRTVVVENKLVGGGSAAEDVSAQHIAALAALAQRPVKRCFPDRILKLPSKAPCHGGRHPGMRREAGLLRLIVFILTQSLCFLCGPVLEACTTP